MQRLPSFATAYRSKPNIGQTLGASGPAQHEFDKLIDQGQELPTNRAVCDQNPHQKRSICAGATHTLSQRAWGF